MSNINEQDIAEWQEKQRERELFQVEEVETFSFDENGKEDEVWQGFAVSLKEDPSEVYFECRDKENADNLCDFLNHECHVNINDFSIEAEAMDNCIEWSHQINDLSDKEQELDELKQIIFDKEQWIIENTDFKKAYGKNNADVRKQHLQKHMATQYQNKKELEFKVDYIKRRISYLKALVYLKTSLLDEGLK